ncbi:HRDC domain-containing protein [Clostridium estertheticum]|uniref:HRDC domain-containing protein n=1 Tax=Clostridium estertheticum TaxID=238834 RepID=UPI001C7DDACD|nr:HRDC domain-containing protein [Clostridium estertheticum]MBX4263026.1 HRDC domain-containing protein [Clostridium estertheticum]WLC89347.1 HRDC domain-containing protein [Clostridium estertheticum]
MGIFDVIKKSILGASFESKLMKSISTPIFIKEFNKESKNILNLKELLNNSADQIVKSKIDNELNLQKYVQEGFSKVYFELKNSPVPFYGLHNIRLGLGDSSANIDFLMITHQFCYIIKCKSLQGNIEIDSQGNFSRFVKKAEKWSKEGIYSPVEQNRRAEIVLKKILNEYSLERLPVVSLTVFTNPKATLNFKECPLEIKDKVIKVDLLNSKIRQLVENTAPAVYKEIRAKQLAGILKGLDTIVSIDYSNKFKSNHIVNNIPELQPKAAFSTIKDVASNEDMLVKALKVYRTSKATLNKIPPYYIFNNEEMGKIVEVMPKDKHEFIAIKGFGEVKFEKYGQDIINIVKSFTK